VSLLIPLVSHGITLSEIPDRIALYLEIGNCQNDCPGCHSPHLKKPVPRLTPIEEIDALVEKAIGQGANALVIMGGTTNGIEDQDLIAICSQLGIILPVCLYSGRDDEERDKAIAKKACCTWLKTGSYKEALGGLSSPATNQRFYFLEKKCLFDDCGVYLHTEITWTDQTHLFQKGAT
jgi:anaerobic ribonucleoside-triphosphate reductase activating protein